jgi:protein O-GlcNAc transferase
MNRKKNRGKKQNPSSGSKGLAKRNVFPNISSIDIGREFTKALQYHQSGQLRKAEEIYKRILELNPRHSDSLHLLGIIAHQSGKNEIAVGLINKAIQQNPATSIYYFNLGNVFRAQGRLADAVSSYQKALEIKPGYADAYYNLGIAFECQGKFAEAVSSYQKTLEFMPNFAEAHNNLGNVLKAQGRLAEAASSYQKALEIEPAHAEAHNNMGNAFIDQGKLEEAISCFQKALEIKPDFAGAYYNLGTVFKDQRKLDKAIFSYQKALEFEPDLAEAYGELFHQFQRTCTWQKLESMAAKFDEFTTKALNNGTKTAETPFVSLMRNTDPSRVFAIARSWSDNIARAMSTVKTHFSFDGRRSRKAKIVVGYLSNDFRNHAVAHLMLSLFGLHNRDEFKILCYSYGEDDGSYYRTRIRQDCDKFVDLCKLNYADAARCIYEDQVDILIDLKGHTRGNKLEICALRPAPVQARYLGLAGTTGADFFDYIITDRIVMPEDHEKYYSENLVYLPHCYQVNDCTQEISNKDWKKSDFGLPEGSFIFCCFNQGYKIEPVMFDTWMNILRQVPEGVLWLKQEDEITEKNLGQEAERRGVESTKLIFSGRLPKDQHLGRLRLADVALDTRIVNGAITTSDALWAGVPVITLQGSNFPSRMSSSILTAIGLPELITQTLEKYETLAVDLAHNPDRLKTVRQKLKKNLSTEPLFDTLRFAGNIEKAYREMWKIFVAGERPRQIKVVED